MKEQPTLPPGWRWVELGEVCEIIAGQSPPGHTYRKAPEGLPFFQGKADFGQRHPIPRAWCVEPTKLAKAKDILISVRAPVGPTNVANQECCIGRGLAAVRCGNSIEMDFLLFWIKKEESNLERKGSGSTFGAINRKELEDFAVPLPPLSEQKRIAAILDEQTGAVEKARAAAEAQLEAAKALPAAYLGQVFPKEGQELPPDWRWARLGNTATLLPSKSIATEGDVEVQAVTTACLTEGGFSYDGIKTGHMRAKDVPMCILNPGEILIARSNTAELVGRVSLYKGAANQIVASDLTIRIRTAHDVHPEFLTNYLSFLFISGYWRSKAGGASGSMKKITRPHIENLQVPVCEMAEQKHIAAVLNEQMASTERLRNDIEKQLHEINSLPAALLRRAFNGEP